MERVLRFVLFLGLFLSIWGGVHAYVFWRAAPVLAPQASRKTLWAVGLLLGSAYIVGRIADVQGARWLGVPLEVLGATWMGALFFAFVAFLLADLATGFGAWGPSLPARRGAVVLALAMIGAATVQGLRAPAVREESAALARLPEALDGTRLVFVSDLHLGSLLGERWLARRVDEILALEPDLVVVGGDLIDGDVKRVVPFLPELKRLSAPLGVFAVNGNHEHYAGADASARLMEAAGWRVLRDGWAEAAPGLVVAGVDDLTARRQRAEARGVEPVTRALSGVPAGAAVVFVSHTPWGAEEAARLGAGLMLSGHTHAGQLFPFGLLVRLRYPLLAGRYDVNGMTVIVGRGTGTWGPRMRLFGRGEIVRVTLRAAGSGAGRS